MSIEVLVAIIGILGGVIGGLVSGAVQYVVTARQDQWKYKVETQTEAYRALMDAIADLSLYNGSLTQAGVTEPSADQRAHCWPIRPSLPPRTPRSRFMRRRP